jgi:hypothetical protein
MKLRATRLLALLAIAGCWFAAAMQAQRVTGVVAKDAPVTLLPEPGRTPLATLPAGTVVQVLGEEKGWYRISFQDSYLLGDRIGYIRAEHLKLPGKAASAGAADRFSPTVPISPVPSRGGRRSRTGLSDEQIAAAIADGHRQPDRAHGLRFLDTGQTWVELVAGVTRPGMATGFQVQIHTPLAWIRQLASTAAGQKRRFTVDHVTDEMAAPVLRVTAYIDVRNPAADGAKTPSRVSNVVLRSESGDAVVQPLSKDAFSEHVVDAKGGRLVFEGLRLTFPLEAIRQLRGPNGDRSVLLVVTGTNGRERRLELAKQHFDLLPV